MGSKQQDSIIKKGECALEDFILKFPGLLGHLNLQHEYMSLINSVG